MSIRMLACPVPVTRTAVPLKKTIKVYVKTLPEAVWPPPRDAGSADAPGQGGAQRPERSARVLDAGVPIRSDPAPAPVRGVPD
ncbi:hypothetical protein GCM10023176_03610 [Micromonospora coerulea]|uniref:Uncharacterized protein n=1 Tax=Micromonospora coerulea TaxID=47856 RepID=A0ABP8S732_9ACTN